MNIKNIVDKIVALSSKITPKEINELQCLKIWPSREKVFSIIEDLRSILFPGYHELQDFSHESMPFHIGSLLDKIRLELGEQVRRGFCFSCDNPKKYPQCQEKAQEIVDNFIASLPSIMELLIDDVNAAYEGDPAAKSKSETIFCYPGIYAISNQRIAHKLFSLGVELIPRIITEHAHSVTGIDIHPGAKIGKKFFIDHGTGVVIGETTIIGNNVRIYQGVTLGAKSFPLDENGNPIKGISRHPIIEDNVIIYAGATILGRITVGKGSTIGGNVWLTESVPPNSVITSKN